MESHKQCRQCKIEKPASGFSASKQNKDGLQSYCRACENERLRERRKRNKQHPVQSFPEEKRCTRCKQILPESSYHKDFGRLNGLQACCKDCNRDWAKTRYKRRTEQHQVVEPFNKQCPRCRETKLSLEFTVERCSVDGVSHLCRECQAQEHRGFRYEVLSSYSGGEPKCACCGESMLDFLSIDHIDGGGNEHRKQKGIWGSGIYRWLKKNGFPAGYQVLCHNCNQAKGFYGICPHQRAKID